jgi:protein farnesyltransferase subunit beta
MESFGSSGGGGRGSLGTGGGVEGGGESCLHGCWPCAFPFNDERHATHTSLEQVRTEEVVAPLLAAAQAPPQLLPRLQHECHTAYLRAALEGAMGAECSGYDSSRVWLVYWCLQALDLLGQAHGGKGMVATLERCTDFLGRCQHPEGGFGGGPGQQAHAASTYAAVGACLIIGTPRALALTHRPNLAAFFARLKRAVLPLGATAAAACAFAVTADAAAHGEHDTRGTYTVLAAAAAMGILTPALTEGCREFLVACQSPEGGFGGEAGNEAHGGYTYCALAALAVVEQAGSGGASGSGASAGAAARLAAQGVDVGALWRWLAQRQLACEGGFSGRTNKLVDVCYSFWIGAACALAGMGGSSSSSSSSSSGEGEGGAAPAPLALAQQLYILAAAQRASTGGGGGGKGGFRDKPSKPVDHYHTCYALAGLSVVVWEEGMGGGEEAREALRGMLAPTDCVFNVRPERLLAAKLFFSTGSAADAAAAAAGGGEAGDGEAGGAEN